MAKNKENKVRASITIDPEILAQIDEIAEITQESRSALIERFLLGGIEEQRKYLGYMDNPVTRVILQSLSANPVLIQKIACLVGENVTPDEAQAIKENSAKQAELAKKRAASRKKKKKTGAVKSDLALDT